MSPFKHKPEIKPEIEEAKTEDPGALRLPDTSSEAASKTDPKYESKRVREMRQALRKELKRPVYLPDEYEPFGYQAARAGMKYRRTILGLVVLGAGIASVATAGVVSGALAAGAAGVPAIDLQTFFDSEIHDANRSVTLLESAVNGLLGEGKERRAEIVQAAIDGKHRTGPVTLSGADIELYSSANQPVPQLYIGPVRIGIRMGITVFAAGLLLLALTIIAQDIHGIMTKVACAILVVGVVIVGAALANSDWFRGLDRFGGYGQPSQAQESVLLLPPTQ